MTPKSPFTQDFNKLPDTLPIYVIDNALLPGGELPLELSSVSDLALVQHALKTDQLIGLVQARKSSSQSDIFSTGCAGRIRQYRERKSGKLNVMLTGVCRYEIVDKIQTSDGYSIATVDWNGFENDYLTEIVNPHTVKEFKSSLRKYFDSHSMNVDWDILENQPIEEVVNNLVLVMNFDIESKQQLLEAKTVPVRIELFTSLLNQNAKPILATTPVTKLFN